MKILVFGCGALGSVFAGLLAKYNGDVAVVGRNPHIQKIKEDGLKIFGLWGEHHILNINAYNSMKEIKKNSKFDIIFLSVKSYDTLYATHQIKDYLADDGFVISIQNGLGNIEIISKIVGKKRTAGARVIFGAEIVSSAVAKVTVYAEPVMIGKITKNRYNKKLQEIAEILSNCGIPTKFTTTIEEYIWSKTLYNCALNGLSAILNLTYGDLLEQEETRKLMRKIIEEIFLILKKKNIKLPWKNGNDYLKILFGTLIPATYNHRSSMLQDIERGKKTEIDALNGAIVKLGKKGEIPIFYNKYITELVKAKELTGGGQIIDKVKYV